MLGKPRSPSQFRRVLTGTFALRANSGRESPAASRNARRCPPKQRKQHPINRLLAWLGLS
jgi:hypothetical protein